MMKSHELRIGNWISDRGGKKWQINHWESINKVSAKPGNYMCMGVLTETHPLTEYVDYLRPIRLTEEMLLKCGCIDSRDFLELCLNDDLSIIWVGYLGIMIGGSITYIEDSIYLHQLQNLYYTLTGEELKLNIL